MCQSARVAVADVAPRVNRNGVLQGPLCLVGAGLSDSPVLVPEPFVAKALTRIPGGCRFAAEWVPVRFGICPNHPPGSRSLTLPRDTRVTQLPHVDQAQRRGGIGVRRVVIQ